MKRSRWDEIFEEGNRKLAVLDARYERWYKIAQWTALLPLCGAIGGHYLLGVPAILGLIPFIPIPIWCSLHWRRTWAERRAVSSANMAALHAESEREYAERLHTLRRELGIPEDS